jgi:hypothetical protein
VKPPSPRIDFYAGEGAVVDMIIDPIHPETEPVGQFSH